jgi:hypothetical protein
MTALGNRPAFTRRRSAVSTSAGSTHQVDGSASTKTGVVDDGAGGGDEGQRRHQHLVARPDIVQQQRQVQSGGAAGQRGCVPDPDVGGQLPLERIDVGTQGAHPVGVHRVEQQLALVGAHVGRGQEDAGHRAQ